MSGNNHFNGKDFLIGLFVLSIIIIICFSVVVKIFPGLLPAGLRENSAKAKSNSVANPNFCDEYKLYSSIKPGTKLEYKRNIRRVDWIDKEYNFTVNYTESKKNLVSYVVSGIGNSLDKNDIACSSDGVQILPFDKVLIAQLLNTEPGISVNTETFSYKVGTNSAFLYDSQAIEQGTSWNGKIGLTGVLTMPNTGALKDLGYCFNLNADVVSSYAGEQKVAIDAGEYNTYKIDSVFIATPAAALDFRRKSFECEKYKGNFYSKAMVKVKQEAWYSPGIGLVKRHITPIEVSGQTNFLQNGNLPLEITDTLVSFKPASGK
ncbi:MAG: hypothetical protein M1268_04560 [Patescibacteria group bacterium]|nr:hypothetical protein [Patescibacteria group bacterium]